MIKPITNDAEYMASLNDPLSAEKAKAQFKYVIDTMKRVAHQMMQTRAGRDGLRRDLGCSIDGFDEENKAWFGNHPWENHK